MKKFATPIKLIVIFLFTMMWSRYALATAQDEIDKRNQQIQAIQAQIDQYQAQIAEHSSKAQTLSAEITKLNAQIGKLELEIKSLGISIEQTNFEISNTQDNIQTAETKIETHKNALARYLQNLDQSDRENLAEILFKNTKLSDFFNSLRNLQDVQTNLQDAIAEIQTLKSDLEDKKQKFEQKKSELQDLKDLQSSEKGNLESTKQTKNQILTVTKGEESRYQKLVQQSQQDINRIRQEIFYLQQSGISVEDAIKFGQLAATHAGIRPSFLIAILEIESHLGQNVGTGTWQQDMYNCYIKLGKPTRAEAEKSAFFKIINELGLNSDTVKVSHEPSYGCGGAMGPAQFLPTIWLAYESDVARLTQHTPPSPWSIEDAFTAAALKLARAGASSQNYAGEIAAAKAYISGNANCTSRICNYYANAAENKASIIQQNL